MLSHRVRGRHLLAGLALCVFLTAAMPAAAEYKLTPADLKELMPVKEVRPGMRGYGLSVFRGTKIDKFAVKVVGVLPNINSGKSLILIRMGGGPITARQANIIGGMSGSPVYVNGRMIGAVAYGAIFPREPLALVTPIEDMLEVWDNNLPAKPSAYALGSGDLGKPVVVNGQSISRVILQERNAAPISGGVGSLIATPLLNPLRVSGMSARGIERLRGMLSPYGLDVSPGPGPVSGKTKPKVTLQPGSSVGMSLASGDIDMTFIGTLTYRKGNRIVAFGHPALAIGPLDAPMTTAYVHDIMPSLLSSEKMASPIETVGRVSQDRQFSIGGQVGDLPKMIPVTVSVNDLSAKRSKVFNIKVINHPLLSPLLIGLVADESIVRIHGTPGEAVANVKFEVEADEVGKVSRQNVVFNPVSIDASAIDDLTELLFALRMNRFYPVEVRSVKMWVTITDKRNTANIERVFVKEAKYKPGDMIDVGVVLRPYKAERITKYLKIAIPPSTPSGRATLFVRGGAGHGGLMMSAAPRPSDGEGEGPEGPSSGGSGIPDMALADNVKQLVQKFLEKDKNNEIVAKLALTGSSVNVAGEKLSFLPSHLADVMKSSRSTSTRTEREEIKVVEPTEYVVGGSQMLQITIQKKDLSEKKSAPKREEPSGPSPEEPSAGPSSVGSSSSVTVEEGDFFGGEVTIEPEANAPIPGVMFRPSPETIRKVREMMAARAAAQKPAAQTTEPHDSSASSKPDEKPVGRAATVWTQTTQLDFNSGFLTGVSSTSENDLRLSPVLEQMATGAGAYVWSMVSDGSGGVYAGSGNDGTIYRMSADGKLSTVFKSPELVILSLARDGAGNVYAGTSPHGIIYRITPDGKASKLFDADEKHIVALVADRAANVYAATGDKSRVYKIEPSGESKLFFSSTDQNAQALAIDGSDNLYVGTAPNGLVYKVTPAGEWSALYDSTESSITALAVDASGNVYAAANPKHTVVKIPASGLPKTLLEKASSTVMHMAVDSAGDVLAQAQDKVYRIHPNETVVELDAKDDPQLISMALDSEGRLFAGTANPGSIYATGSKAPAGGVYESVAHDAKSISQWGTVSWSARVPDGAKVVIKTRSGNSADPDSSWSAWSPEYTIATGSRIVSQPSRYVQYRAELSSDKAETTPELKDVSIVFMSANQPPAVKISAPAGGEKWHRKQTVRWSGSDPDKDTLTYDIYYSSDLGATWKPLKTGAKGSEAEAKEPSEKSDQGKKPKEETPSVTEDKASSDSDDSGGSEDAEPSPDEIKEMISAIGADPALPVGLRDRVLAEAPAANGNSNGKPAEAKSEAPSSSGTEKAEAKTDGGKSESIKETSYSWDTTRVVDGPYMVKVVASDKTSNGEGGLSAEKISEPFLVVNRAPKLMLFKKTMAVQADKSVKLEGVAWQKLISVSNAQYRADTGNWTAVTASDGVFDSRTEPFALTTQRFTKGEHNIEVKVFDSAGNSALQKVPVKVE
ncbi:MAG: SpoIVB peptidase S55 domain-containing protein [Armatimonadota bacterium]|nr:SpoIVB peptidase S55 domain-containing protein [Armatimonadota bacterium]